MKFRTLIFSMAALLLASFVIGAGICENESSLVPRTLVSPVAFTDSTNQGVANFFPWTINTSSFATFRNQYLYPATAFPSEARSVQSMASRAASFMGAQTAVYEKQSPLRPWEYLQLIAYPVSGGGYPSGSFGLDFQANRTAGAGPQLFVDFLNFGGLYMPSRAMYVPNATITTSGMSDISHNIPDFLAIPWSGNPAMNFDFLLDSGQDIAPSGSSGYLAWDMAQGQGCWRAYGSSSGYNTQYVTRAYGIDDANFVWVFKGLAAPPAASMDGAIQEIVRLLLTPEALRCSNLDIQPDGAVQDFPIMFPGGKDIDPLSPQVTSGAPARLEEEVNSSARRRDFRP
ncbi:hypothetical protein ACFLU6_08890 [Acidobacteriota bacterium]